MGILSIPHIPLKGGGGRGLGRFGGGGGVEPAEV